MNTLRIVLIILGVVFIVGIYLFQSRKFIFKYSNNKAGFKLRDALALCRKNLRNLFVADEPVEDVSIRNNGSRDKLSDEQLMAMSNIVASKPGAEKTDRLQLQAGQEIKASAESDDKTERIEHAPAVPVAKGNELLIAFTVLPKPGNIFTGADILAACKQAGLQFGEFNIFHRYALVNNKVLMTPVCSLVNLFEPGYFDLNNMDEFTTEGLSLFMQLPGPVDGRDAFLILMDVSDKLSIHLNATICDDTRSVLTTQTISHIKEKVENFRFKLRMDALKNH